MYYSDYTCLWRQSEREGLPFSRARTTAGHHFELGPSKMEKASCCCCDVQLSPKAASNTTRVIYTKRVHREGRPLLYSTHRESGRQFLTSDCLFVWARETTQRGESTAKNIKPIGKNLWLRKTNSTCVYIHSTNRLFLSA